MRSLGFGDHSRKGFREEGGSELVLERWVLRREGKGEKTHSRLGRSMGKFMTMIWGRAGGNSKEEARPPVQS